MKRFFAALIFVLLLATCAFFGCGNVKEAAGDKGGNETDVTVPADEDGEKEAAKEDDGGERQDEDGEEDNENGEEDQKDEKPHGGLISGGDFDAN